MLKVRKTRAEIDIGNTIEYDVKPYQVKIIIVKCTKVQVTEINVGKSNEYVTQ